MNDLASQLVAVLNEQIRCPETMLGTLGRENEAEPDVYDASGLRGETRSARPLASACPEENERCWSLSRRADESILIELADGADGNRTLNDLFSNGPIEIMLLVGTAGESKWALRPRTSSVGAAKTSRDDFSASELGVTPHVSSDFPGRAARDLAT